MRDNHEADDFAAYRSKRYLELYDLDVANERSTPNFAWWGAGMALGLLFWALVFLFWLV
jgi:hypothetical protein